MSPRLLPCVAGLVALLGACATPDVLSMYEREKTLALTVATERPADWQPDVLLYLAGKDFEAAVETSIRAALSRDMGALRVPVGFGLEASLQPVITIEDAALKPSGACASCLSFEAVLVGKAAWSLGPASGTIPLDVGAQGLFELDVVDGHVIEAAPRAVSGVRVRLSDYGALRVDPSTAIQTWLTGQLSSRLPRIRIVEIDPAALPLRDLRLRSDGSAIRIEALSDVPDSRPAAAVTAPSEGVRLALSETALVGLARRTAYKQGELVREVYADPRALTVQDDRFVLDLRLWRLVGRGWWRDYRVEGALGVEGGKLHLKAEDAEELAKSAGAGLVDPLAALFEGAILDAITDSVTQSLPASRREDLGLVQLRAETTSVRGQDGTLVVDGRLVVRAPDSAARP